MALDELEELRRELARPFAEVFLQAVEDDFGADAIDGGEVELLQVGDQLGQRLGQSGEVERGPLGAWRW